MPSAVSSFFEICDTERDGSKIKDELRIGARGGGFVIERGSTTRASLSSDKMDHVFINRRPMKNARTSLKVIDLVRKDYAIPSVRISHMIEPPIGLGFGTSGSGAIGVAMALSDLFNLRFSLSRVSDYAHVAEIKSVTGLGTVISLISGSGSMGLVTEPGSFSFGRVNAILDDYSKYSLICACFGPIEKSTVILDLGKRSKLNQCARETMSRVMTDCTAESLLDSSRLFAEKSGISTKKLLDLADKAKSIGAVGATQNMIGNAVHCLVLKSRRTRFLSAFQRIVPSNRIFESKLSISGPRIL